MPRPWKSGQNPVVSTLLLDFTLSSRHSPASAPSERQPHAPLPCPPSADYWAVTCLHLQRNLSFPASSARTHLRQVQVHLVTVEVGVERGAVGVVHADRALALEHTRAVGHQSRLVEGRLAICQHEVTVLHTNHTGQSC